MPSFGPQSRSGTRVRRWIVVAGVAAFVALYAGLAIAYLANGSQSVDAGDIDPPDGGVAVLVAAGGINAATPEMDVDVEVLLSDTLLNDDGNPKEQLTLTVEPSLDDADLILADGSPGADPIRDGVLRRRYPGLAVRPVHLAAVRRGLGRYGR